MADRFANEWPAQVALKFCFVKGPIGLLAFSAPQGVLTDKENFYDPNVCGCSEYQPLTL